MAGREVRIELLLGKRVLDKEGKPAGRIEEVRARKQGSGWVVDGYLIGPVALLERLSAWRVGLFVLRRLGRGKVEAGYMVPWDKLDLGDPEKPRLLCERGELEPVSTQVANIVKGLAEEPTE